MMRVEVGRWMREVVVEREVDERRVSEREREMIDDDAIDADG
jgi:hypothetical protein